jgi:ATP-dependent Clp protease protease subunit
VSGTPDWLRERLFERRIVLVTGRLDDAVVAETVGALTTLDADGDAPIAIHLNSPDGTLEAAFAIVDTFGVLRAPVRVHCRGHIGGPAIGVVALADRRLAAAHTRFRLGQPRMQFSGTPNEIARQSQQQQTLLWRFHARLAHVTRRPPEEIAEDMRRGRHLDAREALEYGLIDELETSAR